MKKEKEADVAKFLIKEMCNEIARGMRLTPKAKSDSEMFDRIYRTAKLIARFTVNRIQYSHLESDDKEIHAYYERVKDEIYKCKYE